jgi:hypothetical protein
MMRFVITLEGMVSTLAGLAGVAGASDGLGPAARFREPLGVAVDGAGAVYVTDRGINCIRRGVPAALTRSATLSITVADGWVGLHWVDVFGQFFMETKTDLNTAAWVHVQNPAVDRDGTNGVVLPLAVSAQYFRLRKP